MLKTLQFHADALNVLAGEEHTHIHVYLSKWGRPLTFMIFKQNLIVVKNQCQSVILVITDFYMIFLLFLPDVILYSCFAKIVKSTLEINLLKM